MAGSANIHPGSVAMMQHMATLTAEEIANSFAEEYRAQQKIVTNSGAFNWESFDAIGEIPKPKK